MAEDSKQIQTEQKAQEVTEEPAKVPAWLDKSEGAEQVPAKDQKKSDESLPAWVKNAGSPKSDDGTKKDTEIEAPTKAEINPEKEKAKEKKSIFDNFKEMFSVSDKKQADLVEKVTNEAEKSPDQKKEKLSSDDKRRLADAEKIYQEGISTIRDLIAPSSMKIDFDSIKVEGMYAQSFYVIAYPRYLDSNWLSPVINFDVTMDIAQFIYPIESENIMKILKRKVAQLQSSISIAEEKGNVRDPAVETALQDAEELRTQIQRGQEKFFQLGLYITIYAEDKKKLQKTAKQLSSLLAGKLVLVKKADFQMEHALNSTIPMCTDELEVTLNMNTSPLSTMFPFTSADLTSNKGILYGLNRHNDSLIIFDRFSLENANSVVFAKSGAGKSYAVKLEILRYLMMGTDVIVIDPENEYEALSDVVGGTYLKVSLNSEKRINPFDLPAPLKDEVVQPGDLLRSNIISLHGLLKIMLGGVTPEEEGLLDRALTDTYALRGITMEVDDPSSMAPPTMEDLYDILNSMEGAKGIATRLAKFTQGTYAGIFNKPTNIDLTSGLVVFSIRDLEDALRPIAMYIILNFIWNRVRSSLRKRMLIIDEAWSLMQHDDSAKFLYGLVKRARKYYLGVTTITQDVEDFVQNKFGKPIITNSSMQLLLKQAPAAIEMLQKVFNLTEGEKYMLLNSGIGQGLFFAGNRHVAIQIIASYGEDKLVTTNPEEILKTAAEDVVYEGEEAEGAAPTEEEETAADLGPMSEEVPEPEVEVPTPAPAPAPEAEAVPEAAPEATEDGNEVYEGEAPPVEEAPVEAPPVEAPPVEAPPVEAPPVEAPPVEAPPVEAPPVEAPPVEAPPVEVTPPTEEPPAV
ncbi:VirB4-like conjugal transfer ATPase, CD1110 family [Patescibacteria group bacterium]